MMPAKIKYLALLLGGIAITAQVVLLRSFLAVFYGNELLIGLLLAFWLFWTAVGSQYGNVMIGHHDRNMERWFVSFLYFALLWTAVILIVLKWIRVILAVPSGEYIHTYSFLLFTAPMLAPLCCVLGMCFTFLAQISFKGPKATPVPAATIYIFEAIGSAIGSLAFSFILVRLINHLQILCVLWILTSALMIKYQMPLRQFALTSMVIAIAFLPLMRTVEDQLAKPYWASHSPGMRFVDGKTSRYGELAVIEWGGEKSLYVNSLKQSALPDPMASQIHTALVLHQHPDPQTVLLIEGGIGGLAPELARYPVSRVDYVQMDRSALTLAMQHLDTVALRAWQRPNLNVLCADGRQYLTRTNRLYDVILLSVGRPISALSNRYYTEEFFALARRKLHPDGICAIIGFPSAENYLGQELLQLNAALFQGLKKYFSEVMVLPGDEAIFLAACRPGTFIYDPQLLAQRMQTRKMTANYFYPSMFAQYLSPGRMKFITEQLASLPSVRANRDFQPIAYYIDLILWHKMTRGTTQLLQFLAKVTFRHLLIHYFLIVLLLSLFVWLKRKNRQARLLLWNGACIGFSGITLNVLWVLAMQNIFGYVYEGIGLAMASFMLGLAIAGRMSHGYFSRNARFFSILSMVCIILACLLMPTLMQYLQNLYSLTLFFIAVFASGWLIGAAFPLLCHQYDVAAGPQRWGSIYAADLAGSALGSLFISAIAVPLWGFGHTCLLPAIACASGLGLLTFSYSKSNNQ